nr:ATPase H transporting lysosomal accessory [Hymenolepis microstoma]
MRRRLLLYFMTFFLVAGAFANDANPSTLKSENYIYVNQSCLAFYAKNIEVIIDENPPKTYSIVSTSSSSAACGAGKRASLSLTFTLDSKTIPTVKLNFDFFSTDLGYWTLNKATAEFNDKIHKLLMRLADTPVTMGHKCSNMGHVLAANSDPKVEFVFHGFQVQPFGITDGVFTEAEDCVGFMSSEIFSSLFVIFLLLGIFAYGFLMLMGIQSNDTFDDPKHKMIQLGLSTD